MRGSPDESFSSRCTGVSSYYGKCQHYPKGKRPRPCLCPVDYLSCDVPAGGNTPQTHYAATHFDFTLDEKNGTISYYVKEAGAANVETAIFGPDSITWVRDVGGIAHTTRTISRVDLSFVTLIDIAGTVSRRPGQCSLVDASKRKF